MQELPVYASFKPQFPVEILSDITCYSINRNKNLWLILNNIYIAICIESRKKSLSLDYCLRTPCKRLVRDTHGRLVEDPHILVGDPEILVETPIFSLGAPIFSLETPIFSLETPRVSQETLRFTLETPYFGWRHHIFVGDPQIFVVDKNLEVSNSTPMMMIYSHVYEQV